jgi:hypothetical protein
MSYLEQLKKASQERQQQEQASELQAEQQLAQRKRLFRTQVKPALKRLRQFLGELTEQLNYLKPDTSASYEIKTYGEISDFQQQDYRLALFDNVYGSTSRDDNSDTSSDFVLRCVCQTPYKYRLKKHKLSEAELQKKYFTKYHIRFTYTEEPDANSQAIKTLFLFEPEINVEFKFTGQLKTSTIDLTVTNFAELGKRVIYTLQPKQVNGPFLDELAKYITRQPHNLSLRQKNTSPRRIKRREIVQSITPDKKSQKQKVEVESRTQELAAAKNKTTTKKNGLFRLFKK